MNRQPLKLFCLGLSILLLGGCLSSIGFKSGPTETVGPRYQPEWYLEVPSGRDALFSVGKARSDNPSLAEERAERRARSRFSTTITSVLNTGADTEVPGVSQFERIISQNESAYLELFSRKVVRDGDVYVAYVLLKAPVSRLRAEARSVSADFEATMDWQSFVSRYYDVLGPSSD
jgi:hypothetical protein